MKSWLSEQRAAYQALRSIVGTRRRKLAITSIIVTESVQGLQEVEVKMLLTKRQVRPLVKWRTT